MLQLTATMRPVPLHRMQLFAVLSSPLPSASNKAGAITIAFLASARVSPRSVPMTRLPSSVRYSLFENANAHSTLLSRARKSADR
jgi:hypothetical protein